MQGVEIAPVPGYLDGVANGPFYPAWGGLEGFGHLGVENLGDGVDNVHIVHRQDDGLPQILVALDMGGDADLVNDVRDHALNAGPVHPAGRGIPGALPSPDLLHALHKDIHIAGLEHEVSNPQTGNRCGNIIRHKGRSRQGHRLPVQIADGLQHTDAVLLAEHQVQHQHLGLSLIDQPDGLLSVARRSNHLEAIRTLQSRRQSGAKFLRTIRNQHGCLMIHTNLSCPLENTP